MGRAAPELVAQRTLSAVLAGPGQSKRPAHRASDVAVIPPAPAYYFQAIPARGLALDNAIDATRREVAAAEGCEEGQMPQRKALSSSARLGDTPFGIDHVRITTPMPSAYSDRYISWPGQGGLMRILFVEDHAMFRGPVKRYLQELFAQVEITEAADLRSALELRNQAFDLILLDLQLPDAAGDELAALTAIRSAFESTRVVVLSGHDHARLVARAIEQGACGFISKASEVQVLRPALELILLGQVYLPPRSLDRLLLTPDAGVADPDAREQNIAKLTPRERDVIRQLVHGKSNKEIARILSIEDGTVKQHLNSAFTKLGVTNRTQAAIAIANVKL
jgi:DNA-binding NarL/FixJ family response regulator